MQGGPLSITLRKYPYPYRAMLAICSDLDGTPNKHIYFEIARYLNTKDRTSLGQGVGLEVGNSIYFDMPPDQFSYTNTDADGRRKIHKLVESGHIDCLHSFGDYVHSRERIEECWAQIQGGSRKIEVWIDHSVAPTNIDNGIMEGRGAIVGSESYHTDLTVKTGSISFIWKGRITSVFAQNCQRSFRGLFSYSNPISSFKTIILEFAKGILAYLGNQKYAMHKDNKLMRNTELLDGSSVFEFMRTNPSWAGVSTFETTRGIHNVLNVKNLSVLSEKQGCCALYTHLGKINSLSSPFSDGTRNAFEFLSDCQSNGTILTTTTRRLLGYIRSAESIQYDYVENGNDLSIYVRTEYSHGDLQGIAWYLDRIANVNLYINNEPYLGELNYNEIDHSGNHSVSIPWKALRFPEL